MTSPIGILYVTAWDIVSPGEIPKLDGFNYRDQGQTVEIYFEFRDQGTDTPTDPGVDFTIAFEDPAGNVTSIPFGEASILSVSTGLFRKWWVPDAAGLWFYRVSNNEQPSFACERRVMVRTVHAV